MRYARLIAIIVLGFLGIGAFIGAIPMMIDPSGKLMGLPPGLLDHSPFHSFLIPAIILLVANGILSLAVLVLAVRRVPGYSWWVAFQGCVLAGWITVEMIMMRAASWAHLLYCALALLLIVLGLSLTRGVPANQ